MKLKPSYDKDNNDRIIYREDENGKEYLYYRDKKHGVIIRDFTQDDAKAWFNCMMYKKQVSAPERNIYMKHFITLVNKRKDDDDEFSLMVTDLLGKMIAEIDGRLCDEDKTECDIEIVMKDMFLKEQRGEDVVEALCTLHRNYQWQDAIYMKDEDGNRMLLQVS